MKKNMTNIRKKQSIFKLVSKLCFMVLALSFFNQTLSARGFDSPEAVAKAYIEIGKNMIFKGDFDELSKKKIKAILYNPKQRGRVSSALSTIRTYRIIALRDNIDLDGKEIGDITPMFKSFIFKRKKNSVRMAYILYTFQDEDFQQKSKVNNFKYRIINGKKKWFLK